MSNTSKNNNNKDHEAPLNNTSSPSSTQGGGRGGPQNYAPQQMNGPPPQFQQHGQQPPQLQQPLPPGIQQPPLQQQQQGQPQQGGGRGQKGAPHSYSNSPQQPQQQQQQQPQQQEQQQAPQQLQQQPPQQPAPQPSHKQPSQPQPQSVINSTIPQRTLSAPPSLEESGPHHPQMGKGAPFVPQKSMGGPPIFTPQYAPVGPGGYKQRPPYPVYGEPVYGMYQPPPGNYYPGPGYGMPMPNDQFYPSQMMPPPHMSTPPIPVAKITQQPRKVLTIIDPTTKATVDINTSPPKQPQQPQPQQQQQSPQQPQQQQTTPPVAQSPSFSSGSKGYRNKKQEKEKAAEKEKADSAASSVASSTDISSSSSTPSNEHVEQVPTTPTPAAAVEQPKLEEVKPVVESTPVVAEEIATPVQSETPVAANVADDVKKEETTNTTSAAAEEGEIVEPAAAPAEEEEEEEWEKKGGDEPVANSSSSSSNNNIILSSSGTNPFASRSSGVIRYSNDEMWKLRPQHMEARPELKDLFAGASDPMQNKYGPQGGKQGEKVFTGVIHQIFEKAISEAKYVTMYSNLCKKIFEYERIEKEADRKVRIEQLEKQLKDGEIAEMPTNFVIDKDFKPTFRTLLLSTCQEEYEKIQKLFESGDECPPNLTPQEMVDWEEKQFIQRKKFFGLIKFIAELFKQEMLSEKIIHAILIALMGELVKPQEINLECFCKLLAPIGAKIVSRKDPEVENFMKGYYQRMETLIQSPNLSQRIKFLIQNVLDLKDKGWKQKPEDLPKPAKEERNLEEERKQTTGVRSNQKNNMFATPMSFNRPISKPGLSTSPVTSINPPNKFTSKPVASVAPVPSMNNPNPWGAKKSPANPRAATATTPAAASKDSASSKAWDDIQNALNDVVEEYLENGDKQEMVECIKDYVTSPDFYPNVISLFISSATEQSNPKSLIDLVVYLVQDAKIFTSNQFILGFEKFISTLPDIFEDRPAAYEPIGKICYHFYNSQFISLQQFSSTLSQQVENIEGSMISKILIEFIKMFNDTGKAVQAFNSADQSISTFYGQSTDRTVTDTFDKANLSSFLNQVKF
ncbi:eukaryotic translation initiation factor 4 gamma [Cavenderia fasciculata]|uniref:Eukaryotic translation initiation factor 4 gamma n=1 Tax=Cavenderia fasciculata TaxID=261658 RepID=F4PUJ0_CACFS|nr:eukaryotic translation initiation factor 4 gamma [Cavenderia fasciculata]EGG21854.1 eukaryotic translation initiation factor 4 gamma [Cavenderia fasciculata]|eukprot:XP_004359705.1 eukaryotic translation initiation factor 4 gamma [Cavenderia fasciculata]